MAPWYTSSAMNTLEWIIWAGALLLTGAYVTWRYRSWRSTLLILMVVAVPLALSLDRMTQFMTIDEPYFTFEANYLASMSETRFWFEYGGKFRTSYMVYAIPMRAFSLIAPNWTEVQDYTLLKVASWLVSFVLLGLTHWLLEREFIADVRSRPAFFLLFFVTYLLLPVNDAILRAFTYDALSLQLGVLAVILIVVAFRQSSPQVGLIAVLAVFLAAQEKPNIAPILFVIIPLYAYLGASINARGRDSLTLLVKGPLTYLGIAMILTLGLSLIEATLLTAARNFRDGLLLFPSIIDPYTSWAQSVSTFTFGVTVSSGGNILVLLATIALFYVGTLSVIASDWLLKQVGEVQVLQPLLKWGAALLLIAVIGLGLYGALGVEGYLAGVRPIEAGSYAPATTNPFMGGARYFGAETFLGHTLSFVAYQCGLVLTDVPTVFWALAAGTMLLSLFVRLERSVVRQADASSTPLTLQLAGASSYNKMRVWLLPLSTVTPEPYTDSLRENTLWTRSAVGRFRLRPSGSQSMVGLYLALIGGLLLPIAFGVFNIPYPVPYSSRYMNVGVVLIVLMLCVIAWQRIQILRPVWQYILVGGYIMLFIAELLPFGPFYGAFRPIWLNPSEEMQAGVAVPAWGGWGEEVMQVGILIQEQCGQDDPAADAPAWASQPCDAIDFYGAFPGIWFISPTEMINTSLSVDPFTYTDETDYWIVSRSALIIGWASIPTIEPEATLSYRDYSYAWVYQGSKLAESGYFGSDRRE